MKPDRGSGSLLAAPHSTLSAITLVVEQRLPTPIPPSQIATRYRDAQKPVLARPASPPLDTVKFTVIAVTRENPGELDHLRFLVDGIDDPILTLRNPEAFEATVAKVRQLLGVRRPWGAAKAQNLEEDLPQAFGVTGTQCLQRLEH